MSAGFAPAQLLWTLERLSAYRDNGKHSLSALETLDLVLLGWQGDEAFHIDAIYPHSTLGDLAYDAFAPREYDYPDDEDDGWLTHVVEPFRKRYTP